MKRIAAVATLVLLTACAGHPSPRPLGPDAPLSARLYEGLGGRLEVGLSAPAHVAVFEVVPGRGVGLYYPAYSAERGFFETGWTPLYTSGLRRYDWYDDRIALSAGRYQGPRYFLLVASRQPLHLRPLQGSAGGMRRLLGHSTFTSVDARRVMNEVVDAVLPYQADADWDTDLLVVWPLAPAYRSGFASNYVAVRCRDGRVETVPVELVRFACARPLGDPGDVVPPVRDTVEVTEPTRRRPEVPATAGGVPPRPETLDRPGGFDRPVDGRRPGGGGGDGGPRTVRPAAGEATAPAEPGPAPTPPAPPVARPTPEPVDSPVRRPLAPADDGAAEPRARAPEVVEPAPSRPAVREPARESEPARTVAPPPSAPATAPAPASRPAAERTGSAAPSSGASRERPAAETPSIR
jgi:hypothetical protein